jgi:hypothetical protein
MNRNAVALAVLIVAVAAANPSVGDGELQRFTWSGTFPAGCTDAREAGRELRAQPTTDAPRLHAAATAFLACADGPYGRTYAVRNLGRFNAAAAYLLAARHEPSAAAQADAQKAHTLAGDVAAFRQPATATGNRMNQGQPSSLETDALRIQRDAAALLGG